MAEPIVIRSSDAGAPQLNGSYGSILPVISYIATLLNWDVVYNDGLKIVIRAKTGTRLFYRINDSVGAGYNSAAAELRAYESMSDIDNGAGLVGPSYISKSKEVNINSRPWIVSADDKFINLVIGIGGTQWSDSNDVYIGPSYCGFGDGIKIFDLLEYSPAMIVGCNNYPPDPNTWIGFGLFEGTKNYFSFLYRTIDGATLNVRTQIVNGTPFNLNCMGQKGKLNLPLYPYNGNLLLSRPILPQGSSDSTGFPHSYIPGFWNPLHRQESFTTGQEITETNSSRTYFALKSGWSGSWYGSALLQLSGEFRA